MAESLDIDSVISAMSNPELTSNMDTLMGGLEEIQKIMDKFDKIMQTVDRLGFKPLLVRAAGLKMGVDAESPLLSEKPDQVGIQPMTPVHEAAMQAINTLTEAEVTALLKNEVPDDPKTNTESTE